MRMARMKAASKVGSPGVREASWRGSLTASIENTVENAGWAWVRNVMTAVQVTARR